MATNITKTNNKKSIVEIVSEIRNGSVIEFLCIDGIKLNGTCGALCTLNYSSAEDKETGINFIQTIVDNSDKRGWPLVFEVAKAYQMAAIQQELGIPADAKPEIIKINGKNFNILYDKKAIYNETMTEKIADCKDLPDMPKEAVKAVLVERAKNAQC